MPLPYADVDLTVSSKDRFIAYADNTFNQILFSPERTTIVGFDPYDESSLPESTDIDETLKIKNTRLIVSHDRVGDGLPPFSSIPLDAVTERAIDYHRTSAQELIQKHGNLNGKLEVVGTATSIEDIVESLNDTYGLFLSEEDISTAYVSHALTKYLQINAGSVLYTGVIAIEYLDAG